ncbi:ATP-dependent metallopeptidase Hfl [Piromyces finnis]|uniref:ATP-dependent metallopeptidase Hfl n=1 Tax=Piromyces finnis TaxID=1754191 RepID=A0A1Y1UUK2_9FUNG|nr:ATP-dependent metallopeptidase Hfl [Piromyces finnis]|eukprot:ORX41713.1 ATP-dependent metallopeptidase Hfl [Piromyces finnis]
MEKYFKNIYLKSSSLPIRYQSPSLSVIPFTCTRLLSTTQLIPNKLLNYKNIQNHNIHSSIYSSISIPTQSLDINNSLSINTDFNRQYHCTINNVYSKNKLTTEQLYDLSNSIALATGIKLSASSKLVLKSILPKIQKLYYSTNNPQDFNNVNENHNILNNVNFEKDLNTIKSNYNDNNKEKLNITSEENNLNKNNSNINMNIPKSKVKESKGVEYIRKLYKLNPAHYSYNKGQANNYNNTNTNQVYNNAFSYNKNKPIEVIIHETTSWRLFMKKCIVSVTAVLFTIICILSFLEKQNNNGGVPFHDVEYSTSKSDVNFDDVQGVDEAKEELREVVEFLKNPEKFTRIGGKLPKGILLYGPPGTGKTYLAKAVAGESGVPFFQMSGSEFDELYVGVGAKRVRQLVALARKKAPCIVFIDELDAVGSKRNSKDQGYMKQTLNQLLVELDGFNSSEGVIFIAATNQLEALDKALIRPGRFDRHIPVPLPDMSGREKIIETHIKNIHIGRDVDINMLARGTTGFSGADLANLINQAAIKASKDNKLVVHMDDLEWAKDKIIMGIERKTAYVDEESKKATSFHETGHAIVALHTPGALPLHKVTIIQRGDALGVTIQIPTKDKTSYTKKELLAMIDVCMGGRVAEELTYGPDEVSTGASNDLEKATSIAREMVMTYGMADRIGLVSYKNVEWASLNSTTQLAIEAEIKTILENSRQRVLQLIKSHKTEYNNIANTLFIKETLSNEEIKEIASGIDIIKKEKEEAETKRKLQDRKNSMKSKENIDEINKVSNEDGVINNNKKYNNYVI